MTFQIKQRGKLTIYEEGENLVFLNRTEVSDASDVKARLHDVVTKRCKDAGVGFQRMSSRGVSYSIADDAYEEYLHWSDRP